MLEALQTRPLVGFGWLVSAEGVRDSGMKSTEYIAERPPVLPVQSYKRHTPGFGALDAFLCTWSLLDALSLLSQKAVRCFNMLSADLTMPCPYAPLLCGNQAPSMCGVAWRQSAAF